MAGCIWHESLFRMKLPKEKKKKVAIQIRRHRPGWWRTAGLQKAEAPSELRKHSS